MRVVLSLVIIFFIGLSLTPVEDNTLMDNKDVSGFVVLELFTSQGCSSCPPADIFLGDVIKELSKKKLPVYALSFHVDYWNNLGWKDPFSQKKFSKRQYRYAETLREKSVYTPQIVLNGKDAFVGSYRDRIYAAINNELKKDINDILKISCKKIKGKDSLSVQFELNSVAANDFLNIAVVQKQSILKIDSGENRNRILHNYNVVRSFSIVDVMGKKSGSVKLALPSDLENNDMEVIAYVQNKLHMTISCATKANIF